VSNIDHWYAYVELTHRYAFGLDADEGRGVADLFTSDGVWDADHLGYGHLTGRDELEGYFAGSEGRAEAMCHLFSNHRIVESTDDTMRATSYVHGVVVRAGKDVVRHDVVLYDDELTKVDGEWRFARRTLRRLLDFRTGRKVNAS
jgi:hypothetical protein